MDSKVGILAESEELTSNRFKSLAVEVLGEIPLTSYGITREELVVKVHARVTNEEVFGQKIQVKVFNILLASNTIEVFKRPLPKSAASNLPSTDTQQPDQPAYELVYRLKRVDEYSESISSLDQQEKFVLQIITDAKGRGIWSRDIRMKTNWSSNSTALLTKILKTLETKTLVKTFNPKNAPAKKLYIRYHLQPDSDLTGGVFFSNSEFDEAFVDIISAMCENLLSQKYAQTLKMFGSTSSNISTGGGGHAFSDYALKISHSYMTSKEILDTINKRDISSQKLAEDDIMLILNKLVYDNRAVPIITPQGTSYRLASVSPQIDSLSAVPCGVCPVKSFCSTNKLNDKYTSKINPESCIYYKEWLTY